jgi:apolipoprotein N-acyltransferase
MQTARGRAASYGLAAAAGLLVAAPWLDFSLYPLAWIGFAPLLVAVRPLAGAGRRREAVVLGLIAGLAANVPAFSWLVYTMDVFGGFPTVVSALFYFILSLYSASQFALFALAIGRVGAGPLALAAPVLWVPLELLFWNLFPWRMANSQLELPLVMQIGDLTGPYGLSFVIVWANAALAALWTERRWRPLLGAAAAALVVVGYGVVRWPQIEAEVARSPALRVGLVQGNVGIREKGNSAYFDINIGKYRSLSRSLQDEVDVLIWPETVSHEWIDETATHLTARQHPFPGLVKPLIFGGLGYEYTAAADEPRRYNAAFLIDASGRILDRYNKQILLPFGEFLPFSSWLPFIKDLSPNSGDFSAGTAMETLDVPGGARFAPLVCYEDVPAGIARQMAASGANVLLTIFNDAWFGDSMAPYQHEAIAVWRAIENRRYFTRVGNAGDTGIVDPWGRIVERLPLFVEGTIQAEIRLLEMRTFYTQYGDVFAWAVTALAALWLLVGGRNAGS